MTRTMADHARAYRQRKAKKLERLAVLEAALREIAEHPGPFADDSCWYRVDIARQALNPTTSQERVR